MKKKSLFLLLTVGLVGLCQVQFLKAPGWLRSLFGGKSEPARPGDNGGRGGDGKDDPTLRRDPVLRTGGRGDGGGGHSTTGTRPTRGGGGTGGGRVSSGGSGVTSVAGETDLESLGVKEKRAVEEIGNQKSSFSDKGKLKTVSFDIEGRKRSKIILIDNVKIRLHHAGLDFSELKECEGLPSYSDIESKINALYREIIDTSLEEKIPMETMGQKIAEAIRSIKEVESTLAAEYYKRASDDLIEEVSGVNKSALEKIRLKMSSDLVRSSRGAGKPLTLKQVNEKVNILRTIVREMNNPVRRAPTVNQELKAKAETIAAKYKGGKQ